MSLASIATAASAMGTTTSLLPMAANPTAQGTSYAPTGSDSGQGKAHVLDDTFLSRRSTGSDKGPRPRKPWWGGSPTAKFRDGSGYLVYEAINSYKQTCPVEGEAVGQSVLDAAQDRSYHKLTVAVSGVDSMSASSGGCEAWTEEQKRNAGIFTQGLMGDFTAKEKYQNWDGVQRSIKYAAKELEADKESSASRPGVPSVISGALKYLW